MMNLIKDWNYEIFIASSFGFIVSGMLYIAYKYRTEKASRAFVVMAVCCLILGLCGFFVFNPRFNN